MSFMYSDRASCLADLCLPALYEIWPFSLAATSFRRCQGRPGMPNSWYARSRYDGHQRLPCGQSLSDMKGNLSLLAIGALRFPHSAAGLAAQQTQRSKPGGLMIVAAL